MTRGSPGEVVAPASRLPICSPRTTISSTLARFRCWRFSGLRSSAQVFTSGAIDLMASVPRMVRSSAFSRECWPGGIGQEDGRLGLVDVGPGQDIFAGKIAPEKLEILVPVFVFQRLHFFLRELIDQDQHELFRGQDRRRPSMASSALLFQPQSTM